jgi:methylmalonyl-CoA mutase C-terminal domain/subunit
VEDNGPIKVLMVKPGLDAHWRGILAVSHALRDAGMEVIYGGNQTYEGIAQIAVDEGVNVIGLSILAPGYRRLVDHTLAALKAADVTDALIIVGGIMLKEDIPALEAAGVDKVFPADSSLDDIVAYVQEHAPSAMAVG